MSDITSWVGLVIAAASLVVAIIAIIKSGRAQKEANAVQRRVVEIEEQRERDRQAESTQAQVRAELRKVERSYRLHLVNNGAVEANNIRVEIDDIPLADHSVSVESDPMPDLVGPKSEISCFLGLTMSCVPPFKIKVTWDDESGTDRTYCSTLTW